MVRQPDVVDAVFWMTHGHRPQQAALLAVKRAFGPRVLTVGSRRDGRRDMIPADIALDEPRDDQAFVEMVATRAAEFGAGNVPVVVVAMGRRRELILEAARLRAAGAILLAGSTDPATLDLCEDKYRFAELMREEFPGHALPTTLVGDVESLDAAVAMVQATGADACVKPPIGVFGQGFWHLSPETPVSAMFTGSSAFEEFRRVHPSLFRSAYAADPRPLVVMPFLAGTEISIDALFLDGELVRAATRRKKGSLQAIAEDADGVLPALRPMGRRLRLHGIVNIQVRRETAVGEGPYRVLEINTRYSGGSAYLVDAGVDLFSELVHSVLGTVAFRGPIVPLLDIAIRAEAARPEARWEGHA